MALRYDYEIGQYVGERYSVPESAFVSRLQRLLQAGWEPNAALDRLLDESVWRPGEEGVIALTPQAGCRFCGAPLPRSRHAYCTVVCEATACAETAQLLAPPGD